MSHIGIDGGWKDSAAAWLAIIARGDSNRTLLLDPVMLQLCGDVRGLRVLDLGCGEGRFCRMLAEPGATTIGLDLTTELLKAAQTKADASQSYVRGSGDRLPFVDASFDLAIAYLSLIDIPDYQAAIGEAARVLKSGGRLLVAGLSNIASASNGWTRDEAGQRLYHAVDRYLEERPMILEWSGMRIRNWHRPLSAYLDAYLGAGLMLRRFLEPVPLSLRDDPRFEDWFRVPNFDVMLWEKPA